jgi:small basic protein (TIGR04137 family)
LDNAKARPTLFIPKNILLPVPARMLENPSASGRSRSGNIHFREFMSQHRSLRAASTLGAKRNVLKRYERVELLKKRGQWKDGDRVTGLRKTKPAE